MRNYKEDDKIEYKIGIISTFENYTKMDVDNALEVNNEFGIIIMFKVRNIKNTEERKIKGMKRMLAETKNKNFGKKKQVYIKYG